MGINPYRLAKAFHMPITGVILCASASPGSAVEGVHGQHRGGLDGQELAPARVVCRDGGTAPTTTVGGYIEHPS